MKLRVFIGSSSEALEYANAIQESLYDDADCTVWTQGIFDLSSTTFAELLKNLSLYDCAVFVFAPNDKLIIRGKRELMTRDNVLFEAGLFYGRLGAERVFLVAPSDVTRLHVASDLLGVITAPYRSKRTDGNIPAMLSSACSKIRREFKRILTGASEIVPTITRRGFFSDFSDVFPLLLNKSRKICLYFIHSRRWRENNNDHIIAFLKKSGAHLTVFLPNPKNTLLIKAIQRHFEDGPRIPGLIQDAFDYFRTLQRRFPKKVRLRHFNTYPTYSFYKFDKELIVAAYPTTPRKKDVPTFQVNTEHPFGKFVLDDLARLLKRSR
jgi:hypothetical protein